MFIRCMIPRQVVVDQDHNNYSWRLESLDRKEDWERGKTYGGFTRSEKRKHEKGADDHNKTFIAGLSSMGGLPPSRGCPPPHPIPEIFPHTEI